MARTLFLLLLLGLFANQSYPQDFRWGEDGAYSKWERYPYETSITYEFLNTSPTISQFPRVIELARLPDKRPRIIDDREIAVSQLRTISRCNFEKVLNADSDFETEHKLAINKWQQWWNTYGKQYAEDYRKRGRKYPNAWAKIPGTKDIPCPEYPILLPDSWSTQINFRSGDYGGVTQEQISISVSPNKTTLTRKYTHGWPGGSEWTHEEWRDFTHEEAQLFLATLIYSIDNPWVRRDESVLATTEKERMIGSFKNRPRTWSNYYPHVEWSGILDENQNVIVNDDVRTWDTIDYENFGKTRYDQYVGVTYRVVLEQFPDQQPRGNDCRWVKVDTPRER
ncbi:MAG: hypothetical protein AAGG48_32270 [Planctomycetota bacterium]